MTAPVLSSSLLTRLYPCRRARAASRHTWQVTAFGDWFVCAGCGVPAVCVDCFVASGSPLPRGVQHTRCATHALQHIEHTRSS